MTARRLRLRHGGGVGLSAVALLVACSVPLAAQALPDARPGGGDVRVLVVYHSLTGQTAALAEAVADGARAAGASVVVHDIQAATRGDLLAADGIVLGSPTHWANMAAGVQAFITAWPELTDRVGGAFATGGAPSGGHQLVVTSLLLGMLNHGMIVVGPLFEDEDGRRLGAFGATAVTGPADPGVSDAERAEARALGARVAEVAARVRAGRR